MVNNSVYLLFTDKGKLPISNDQREIVFGCLALDSHLKQNYSLIEWMVLMED